MNRPSFYFLALIFCTLPFAGALAQHKDVLPPMNMAPRPFIEDLTEVAKIPESGSSHEFKNAFLRDYSDLQYQISLIEQLIRRQGNIARLEKIYLELGIPFFPPPIPAGICERIPDNLICNDGYPASLQKIPRPEPAKTEPVKVLAVKESPSAGDPKIADHGIKWAEISCSGSDCTAVVIVDDLDSHRRTVKEGDTLPKGFKVKEISFSGVTIEKEGRISLLSPSKSSSFGGYSSPAIRSISAMESPDKKVNAEDPTNTGR